MPSESDRLLVQLDGEASEALRTEMTRRLGIVVHDGAGWHRRTADGGADGKRVRVGGNNLRASGHPGPDPLCIEVQARGSGTPAPPFHPCPGGV